MRSNIHQLSGRVNDECIQCEKIFLPHMANEVFQTSRSGAACARYRERTTRKRNLHFFPASEPIEFFEMDILGLQLQSMKKRFHHSDDGPIVEDYKSDPHVKVDGYGRCDCVTRSLDGSIRYTRSSANRQRPLVRELVFLDSMRVSGSEASHNTSVPFSNKWAGQEIQQD